MKLNLNEVPKCCHGCVHLMLITLDTHSRAEFECNYGSLVTAFLYNKCAKKLEETSIVEMEQET